MDLLTQAIRASSRSSAVSQEGLLDNMLVRMQNFFDRTEREIGQEEINAKKIRDRADKLQEVAKAKAGLVEDSLTVKLAAWAKWLVIDDKLVGDPDELVRELDRITALLRLFSSAWVDSYTKTLNDVVAKLIKPGMSDAKKALEALKPIAVDYYPSSFNSIMKKSEKIEWSGKQVDVRCSEKYLGIGSVRRAPSWFYPEEAFRIEVSDEGYKRTEPQSAEIIPFSPGQVVRVLDAVKRVLDAAEAGSMDEAGKAQAAVYEAMEAYESKTGQTNGHGNSAQSQIWSAAWTFMHDFVLVQDLLQQTDHICQVAVKLCDGSLRRSK